jgi:hypothetical protein
MGEITYYIAKYFRQKQRKSKARRALKHAVKANKLEKSGSVIGMRRSAYHLKKANKIMGIK